MKSQSLLPLAFAGLALAQSSDSLADVLSSNSDSLSSLTSLLQNNTATLDALTGASNITILAPSNDALDALLSNPSVMAMAMADPGLIPALLSYHVLNGTYMADDIMEMPAFVQTLLSNSTYENVTGSQVVEVVKAGDTISVYSALKMQANVTQGDISFDGGVIHVINEVLMIPYNLSSTAVQGNLTAAAGALTATDLVAPLESMMNITVFAPNNDAFAAIGSVVGDLTTEQLAMILQYHVIPGTVGYSSLLSNTTLETASGETVSISIVDGAVYVDAAKVLVPDILIANGVVHIIDSVLNPNGTDDSSMPNPTMTMPAFEGATTASDGGVPFTSGVEAPTEMPTGENTTPTNAAVRDTAAVALGALFGGAALLANGI